MMYQVALQELWEQFEVFFESYCFKFQKFILLRSIVFVLARKYVHQEQKNCLRGWEITDKYCVSI